MKIKKIFCLLLPLALLCCGFAACGATEDFPPPDYDHTVPGEDDPPDIDTSVKIMSYNLDQANGDKTTQQNAVLSRMVTEAPDLIGVQEETCAWRDFLKPALEIEGYEHVLKFRGNPPYDEASGVFYKVDRFALKDSGTFWLSDTPDSPGTATSWGALYPRVCSWLLLTDKKTGRDIAYFNTHFSYVSEFVRTQSAQLILSRISALGVPAFFSGDLNFASEREPGTYGILTAALDDSRTAASKTTDGCTFHDYGKKPGELDSGGENTIASVPIDYIFCTKDDFTAMEFAILSENGPVYSSDHYAITATFDYHNGK